MAFSECVYAGQGLDGLSADSNLMLRVEVLGSTAVLLYYCTAVLLYCCTAVLLYCCTAALLYCCTAVLLYYSTALLLYCCTAAQEEVVQSSAMVQQITTADYSRLQQ